MILPTKHIKPHDSLLGVGATLLDYLVEPKTVSALWEEAKVADNVGNFERFALAANLLFLVGAIDEVDGILRRVDQ